MTLTDQQLAIAPATSVIGAYVDGVDLRAPLGAQTVVELSAALARWKVLFFRNQPISYDEQIAFAPELRRGRHRPTRFTAVTTTSPRSSSSSHAWRASNSVTANNGHGSPHRVEPGPTGTPTSRSSRIRAEHRSCAAQWCRRTAATHCGRTWCAPTKTCPHRSANSLTTSKPCTGGMATTARRARLRREPAAARHGASRRPRSSGDR